MISLGLASDFGDTTLEGVITRDLVPNMLGCFLMGALIETKGFFSSPKRKSIHFGLCTGLCGCLTTFSGLSNIAASFLWLPLLTSESPLVGRWLLCLLIGLCTSWVSYRVGKTLAIIVFPYRPNPGFNSISPANRRREPDAEHHSGMDDDHSPSEAAVAISPTSSTTSTSTPTLDTSRTPPTSLLPTIALLLLSCIEIFLVLFSVLVSRSIFDLALIFAPVGTWARVQLARLNVAFPYSRLGTLSANTLGCAIAALVVCFTTSFALSTASAQWLRAISVGGAGSLSTMSTLMYEVELLGNGAPRARASRNAARYLVFTVLAAQVVAAIVLFPTYQFT